MNRKLQMFWNKGQTPLKKKKGGGGGENLKTTLKSLKY